ncbi:MAG: hypothetical protein HZA02_08660 [Nitrospinae bacterium]|nr:hypothetical protein [Nitrospinota bacterium]
MELLIALAVGLLLVSAIYATYIFQSRSTKQEDLRMEAGQNARNSMDVLSRDVRMLGAGVPTGTCNGTLTPPDKIISATNNSIQFRFNLDAYVTQLTAQAASGSNTLPVVSSSGFAAGQLIYISDGVCWESMTLAAAPGSSTQINLPTTLSRTYSAGSSVNVVDTVSYAYDGDPLELQRTLNGGTTEALANNIDYVQFKYYDSSGTQIGSATPYTGVTLTSSQRSSARKISILVVARTSREENQKSSTVTYEDGASKTDGYHRIYLESDLQLRNM